MIRRQRAHGFSLISAIFLVTVLSALGAFIVTVGTVQYATQTSELRSARALSAAQAGIEWAGYQTVVLNNCPNVGFGLTEGAFAGFNVAVTCATSTHRVGANDLLYFVVTATATSGVYGTPDFTARTLNAKFIQ